MKFTCPNNVCIFKKNDEYNITGTLSHSIEIFRVRTMTIKGRVAHLDMETMKEIVCECGPMAPESKGIHPTPMTHGGSTTA